MDMRFHGGQRVSSSRLGLLPAAFVTFSLALLCCTEGG